MPARYLLFTLALACSLEALWLPAVAQGSAPPDSLESLWQESKQTAAAPSPSSSQFAPMSLISDFQGSALVTGNGWPGLGPFAVDQENPYMLRDPARNTIELSVSGDRITALELILLDKDKRITPLDLEMVTDFLLEAAGLSSGKIHKFNEQMQSVIQSIVASTDKEPIRLNASRYLLTLRRPDPGEPLSFYRITVNSMDASREVLAEHSAPTLDTSTGSSSEDRKLKGEFQSLVESWHKIKHAVVRQLKKEDLSSVLAGKALARQTDAINWLVKNGKHYEMKSQGIELERFEALEPGKRYSVYVEVRESSKLIDDKSRQVLKQSDDSYQVNYTVEKIKGHWYITDSMIVEEAGAKAKRGSNS